MILMYLKTGHAYRVADTLTVTAVNTAIAATPAGHFTEVPLAVDAPQSAGTPEALQVFVTPASVSHFAVLPDPPA